MLTLVKKFHDWANNNNSCVCYMWNALRNRSLAKWARVTRSHFIHRGNHRVTCAFRARLSAMHVLKWTIAGASWREKSTVNRASADLINVTKLLWSTYRTNISVQIKPIQVCCNKNKKSNKMNYILNVNSESK